jgi:hypothetical protein
VQAAAGQQRRALLRCLVKRSSLSGIAAATLCLNRCAAGGLALSCFSGLPCPDRARYGLLLCVAGLLRRCSAQRSSSQWHAGLSFLRSSVSAFSLGRLPVAEFAVGVACMPVGVTNRQQARR